jgi:transcriptional regulator with GAF, ATPase, and Fis domain
MMNLNLKQQLSSRVRDKRVFEQRLSRNWYLLVGVTIASTVGLAVAVAPLLSEQLGTIWPWPNTHIVLLGGLAVSVVVLAVYLTVQQRRFTLVCQEIQQLEEESSKRERQDHARLKALLNISRMMGSVTNLEDVFKGIMDACIELFNAQQASLMLLNSETNELEVRAATGHLDKEGVRVAKRKVGEGVAGWVAKKQQPLVLGPNSDASQIPDLEANLTDSTAALVVPVMLREELVGVLSIRSRVPGDRYSDEDLQALRVLAENIGTLIRHSEHVEWMRKTIEDSRSGRKSLPIA